MKIAFALLALVAAVAGQRYVDPKQAAILQEARYLSGDGSFGSAYNQEDGTQFKEETDASGNRRGQYSYIGDDGKTITVQYTAGKNGFQVSGDHLPRAPIPAPQHRAPAPAPPQYNQQPQYNAIPNQGQSYNKGSNNGDDGSYRADVYETPYQYRNELHTTNYPAGNPSQINQAREAYNPFHNPHVPDHLYNQAPQPQQANFQFQQTTTTPSPNRFFPPGNLDLNRTPDGFQFQFNSNRRN